MFLDNQIDIIATSLGVIPLIRAACPSEQGRAVAVSALSRNEGQEFHHNPANSESPVVACAQAVDFGLIGAPHNLGI